MSVAAVDLVDDMSSPVVDMGGLVFDALTEAEVVEHVLGELRAGRGGRVATVNVDIFRAASRDPRMMRLLTDSALIVADGMPLVWAAKLRGTPVPERVTGASLILSLSRAAAEAGRSVYLLGGGPPGVAEQARDALCDQYPDLVVAGVDAPPQGFDASDAEIAAVCERVAAAEPDIVFVGLGFPRQERLIARLAPLVPASWFLGCGAAISFAAGTARRAPGWMQQTGLEWLFRLVREPRRLAPRYLVHDLPVAGRLLASSLQSRVSRPSGGRPSIAIVEEISPVLLAEEAISPVLLAEEAISPVLLAEEAISPVLLAEEAISPVLLAEEAISPVLLAEKADA